MTHKSTDTRELWGVQPMIRNLLLGLTFLIDRQDRRAWLPLHLSFISISFAFLRFIDGQPGIAMPMICQFWLDLVLPLNAWVFCLNFPDC